ncbi:hypothetical protein AURDEDRAFT_112690 [Auricularia subglabra TFB-10046 SS5]|nr:hypothetical protein AURDEDRAFT_112690 [Auricularia subglabra TFB-10046 SS5]
MFFKSSALVAALALVSSVLAAPVDLARRQNPCFVTGSVALPAEVQKTLGPLAGVTCNGSRQVAPGVPDVTSGGISFSSIDFQKSKLSPVGFALSKFKTPADPATADLAKLQNQLNVYLAVEAGVRSQPNNRAVLDRLKGAKFFIQFQVARVRTARGERLGVADTVEHQLGKVLKNAVGATAAEKAQVEALAKQL